MIFENATEEIKGMDSGQADIRPGIHRDIGETNSLLPFVFAAPYISWKTSKVRPFILTNQVKSIEPFCQIHFKVS